MISSFIGYPSPSPRQLIRYRPNDRLAAGINVHVFNPDRLFSAALELGERFGLHRVGTQELGSQSAVGVQMVDELCALRPIQHVHRQRVRDGHLSS
ncbi:MAG TPA: hypothetical protein VFE60_29000 [Roseiarcus sp.]|nr:hypothetical protein [Roseiarcus sp.]